LFASLFAMTAVGGMVDAASFLGLGHVFTGNMTGNVLLLGFAASGTPGSIITHLSVAHSLISLGAFVGGAIVGSLLVGPGTWSRYLTGLAAEWVSLGAATLILFATTPRSTGIGDAPGAAASIALLALAMGTQIAVVRRIGVAEVRTTVVTTSLAGLFIDAAASGGVPARARRRVATLSILFVGALIGALIERHGVWWTVAGAWALFTGAMIAIGLGHLLARPT
jgi:uncharacterized membrane protein YoaK (UPF0700 family)